MPSQWDNSTIDASGNIVQNGKVIGRASLPNESPNETYDRMHQDLLNQIHAKVMANNPSYLTSPLTGQNALPWQTYLPEELGGPPSTPAGAKSGGGLAGDITNRASDPNQMKNDLMGGLGSDSAMSATNVGGGPGGSSPMGSALSRKYQHQVGNKLSAMQNKVSDSVPVAQSNQMNRAASIYGSAHAVEMQNFKEQYSYNQQRAAMYQNYLNAQSAAEANTWAQIISGAATVAGYALMAA